LQHSAQKETDREHNAEYEQHSEYYGRSFLHIVGFTIGACDYRINIVSDEISFKIKDGMQIGLERYLGLTIPTSRHMNHSGILVPLNRLLKGLFITKKQHLV
jgi:hypothetical protein